MTNNNTDFDHYRGCGANALAIEGPTRLQGRVCVGGSKNAALPIIAASILADEPIRLTNVPRLGDIDTLAAVLESLGVSVRRRASHTLELATFDASRHCTAHNFVRQMRASFCVLGPLLARRGRATVALPGGCRLGPRPVELHLRGLAALGADIQLRRGYVVATARRLQGARIEMIGPRGPTVTGTANLLTAATLARGTTEIIGAAREPEIVDLGRFLNRCGAQIKGIGTSRVIVRGVDRLQGSEYHIMPDRIEAATLLAAAAAMGERVAVTGLRTADLTAVTELLASLGARLRIAADTIVVTAPDRLKPFRTAARPFPGVPTDCQALLVVLAALAGGTSTIRDTIFPERWAHVPELQRMGAEIRRRGPIAKIDGREALEAAEVVAPDLRAAAALVLAAMAATGTTTLHGMHHLDRGYERLDWKLAGLGAACERRNVAPLIAYSPTTISRPLVSNSMSSTQR